MAYIRTNGSVSRSAGLQPNSYIELTDSIISSIKSYSDGVAIRTTPTNNIIGVIAGVKGKSTVTCDLGTFPYSLIFEDGTVTSGSGTGGTTINLNGAVEVVMYALSGSAIPAKSITIA